ncbi:hypothetical protein Naga_101504g1, partial [Nannochloropsis gaditana]
SSLSLSLSLGGHRKSQHVIKKPVLTAPSPPPSSPPSHASSPPSSSTGFRALLEAVLWGEGEREDAKEGGKEGGTEGGTEGGPRFTLPDGRDLVAGVKVASKVAWEMLSSTLCALLLHLLRRLPFVPEPIGRQHWGRWERE